LTTGQLLAYLGWLVSCVILFVHVAIDGPAIGSDHDWSIIRFLNVNGAWESKLTSSFSSSFAAASDAWEMVDEAADSILG
jgi:hypothetical protein